MAQRARFVRLDLEPRAEGGFRSRVELEWEEEAFSGWAEEGGDGEEDLLRCVGRATTEALERMVGAERASLELLDIEAVRVLGSRAVVVAVSVKQEDDKQYAVGLCMVKGNDAEAAARAVLNSTNRIVQLLLPS